MKVKNMDFNGVTYTTIIDEDNNIVKVYVDEDINLLSLLKSKIIKELKRLQ